MRNSLLFLSLSLILLLLSTFNPKNLKDNLFFFSVKNIEINNIKISNKNELTNYFKKELYGISILKINDEQIDKIASKFDLIEYIEIKKIYPNKIKIKVLEKKPIAIFFSKKKFYYITEKGEKINFFHHPSLDQLPNIIGTKDEFLTLYKVLKEFDFPLQNIKSFHQHAVGRWDILFVDKRIIKLPKKNFKESIQNYIKINEDPNFKKYFIFDYRISDQLILK